MIYLDHCATTPVHPHVVEAMLPFFLEGFGNPSSIHAAGRAAAEAVDRARESVAGLIGAEPSQICFTSGGTEANNLAILGTAFSREDRGRHLITSAVEHPSVLKAFRHLETKGFTLAVIPVDGHGRVDPGDVRKAIRDDTILISVMHANNEVGTIEPIEEIGKIAAGHGIPFHTDAVQTAGKLPLDVRKWPVDLLSLSAHKMQGPKGTGALYIRDAAGLCPMIFGGGQEKGLRSGTENVAGVVGLGKACEIALSLIGSKEDARLGALRDRLQEKLLSAIPGVRVNGHPDHRLPHVLCVSFPGLPGEAIVRELDRLGIAISAGSACSSHSAELSHVVTAMGLTREAGIGTVRISLGSGNREDEIDQAAQALAVAVGKIRSLSELEESLGSRRCY